MALSCADFRIIFVLGSLGLLPRSLKIKRTNEVIDDLDFPDFHPLWVFSKITHSDGLFQIR